MNGNHSAFDPLSWLINRFGKPTKVFTLPKGLPVEPKRSLDMPKQYAIWINPEYEGGCMVAANYGKDRWLMNPTCRPLILHLLLRSDLNNNVTASE